MDTWWLPTLLWLAGIVHHVLAIRRSEKADHLFAAAARLTDANCALVAGIKEASALHVYGAREEAREVVTEAIAEYEAAVGRGGGAADLRR